MKHFAQTHSLTVIGGQSSPVRLIMLVGKSAGNPRPCYWLRLNEADLKQAIAIGQAALKGPFDLIVALAGAEIADQPLVSRMALELAVIGIFPTTLTAYSAARPQTGFSLHERLRQFFRRAGLLFGNRGPAGSGSAGAHH